MDNGQHEFVKTQCPVCRNVIPEIMIYVESIGEVNRILCKACDTIYFDRQPPEPPKYDINYNKHFFRPGDIRKAGIMAAKLGEIALAKWKTPNILEAGAGNGLTVLLLRALGLNAFGLDLDPKLGSYLMAQYKIPIIAGRFEEFNPPGKFHLIYSSHVIEHTQRPDQFMKKAFSLLEDGGYFYIDTPDTHYFDQEGKRWHHFETRNPFEHCCILGHVGLRLLANEAGFDIKSIERYGDFMSQQAIFIKPQSVKRTI